MDTNKRVLLHLPDNLITLILLRLPVKSLLRFKLVSKFFFSLISDTQFTKHHFDLAASPSHRLYYIAHTTVYGSLSRSIDLSSSSLHTNHNDSVALIPPFLKLSSVREIRGSCNGFILLCDFYSHLFIWNPSTGAHKELPPYTDVDLSVELSCLGYCGFGYDASTYDYLVFLSTFEYQTFEFPDEEEFSDEEVMMMKIDYKLFSLRANAWNTIEVNHFPYGLCCLNRNGILFNGVLHWLALSHTETTQTRVIVILAFDLKEKSFSEVPLPLSLLDYYNKYYYAHTDLCQYSDLCVLDGCLCLSVPRDNATEIWVMNEYKVVSSWKKTLELCMTAEAIKYNRIYCHPQNYFFPRYSTKHGDIVGIVGVTCGTRVVKLNAKGQLLEHHSYLKDDDLHSYISEAIMYTESMLSFPS